MRDSGPNHLKAVNLGEITQGIRSATRPVTILWQAEDTLAFVARGREHRSEFRSDPSDEVEPRASAILISLLLQPALLPVLTGIRIFASAA